MILSRFWFFLLAAAAGAALTAALLAQATFNREHDTNVNNQLRRDRIELEALLRIDARNRIDAIAPIAAHSDVRDALRKASGNRNVTSDLRKELTNRLESLNGQLEEMEADLLFAVDDEGEIVVQIGGKKPPKGASLGAFPLLRRTLAGFVRDDVWVYNDHIYRMAARPVIAQGQYVGAIVHGMALDEELAQRLAKALHGASVAFFMRDRVVAAHMPSVENAARSLEMEAPLGELVNADGELMKEGRIGPVDLGQTARGYYALVSGAAAHAGVGYVVARPRNPLVSPWAIFEQASSDDVQALPWPILGGGAVGLFLLGMLWLWLERDRPYGRLRGATTALAAREVERLTVTDFGGSYRKLAESINEALDRAVEHAAKAAPRRKAADLDEILGPTPGSGGGAAAQPYFGFAHEPKEEDVPAPPPSPGGAAEPAKPASPKAPPPGPPPAAGPGGPKRPAPPAPPPPKPAGGPSAGAPLPPRPPTPGANAGARPAAGPPAGQAPAAAAPPPASPGVAPPNPNARSSGIDFPPADEEDEGATMVSEVPEELLAAVSGEASSGADEEQRHFRDVFQQFTKTKEQCGESTAGLTFDKFSQTLRKNRDQIVQRHGARKVRFTVYVKEGKAALKATPVKD